LFYAYDCDGAAVAQLMDDLKRAAVFAVSQGALQALRESFDSGPLRSRRKQARDHPAARQHAARCYARTRRWGAVAEEHLQPGVPMITLATAHPAKFPDAVEAATGLAPRIATAHGRSF
jgi:threonine synthase